MDFGSTSTAFEDSPSSHHHKDLPLFPDTFSELHEPNYMASPFLEDPTDFTVSLDANSTTTCSSLVDMEPSTFNVANNPQLIPTPPPESAGSTPKHHGRGSPPAAAQPGGGCSPHHSNSTSNSASEYIKGSSLEESPVSSPSTCSLDLGGGCGGDAAGTFNGHNVIVEHHMQQHGTSNCNGASKNGTLSCTQVKVESNSNMMSDTEQDQHGSSISERAATGHLGSVSSDDDEDKEEDSQCSADGGDADDQSSTAGSPQAQSNIPKNVKLPQRKGGMQLWQFLYALLSDMEKKYSKLIEWTSNNRSREFRLLEPEAIAIWWGEHKNKKNMSYDKLSRSLRYYYDKGIIRKIPGERYVYQFCIDPELMYKHIGNSDCRPKLKPMPQAAQHATSDYQMKHGYPPVLPKDPLFIAQGPVSLSMLGSRGPATYGLHHEMFMAPNYPGLPTFTQSSYYDSTYMSSGLEMSMPPSSAHASVGYSLDKAHVPPMRKCRSFDSASMYSNEPEVPYTPPYMPGPSLASSMPSVIHTPPPGALPPHDLSPPPASSGGTSPIAPSFSSRGELLDELIEFTSTDSYTTQHPAVYSTCDGSVSMFSSSDNMATTMWNFQ